MISIEQLEKQLKQLKMKDELSNNGSSIEYRIALSKNINNKKFKNMYKDIKDLFSKRIVSNSLDLRYNNIKKISINVSAENKFINIYLSMNDSRISFHYEDNFLTYKIENAWQELYCYDIFYCVNDSIHEVEKYLNKKICIDNDVEINLNINALNYREFKINNLSELNNFDLVAEKFHIMFRIINLKD